MGDKKIKLVTIGSCLAVLFLLSGLALILWGARTTRNEVIQKSVNSGCLSAPKDYVMPDDSMEAVLLAGHTYSTFENWQHCVRLQQGDVILYRYSPNGTPIARMVAAVPGDRIELVRNLPGNNWHIKVNGELYKSNGVPYYFGSAADHPISLYQNAHQGLLDNTSLLIFSKRPPGGRDSGEFGVVHINDIVSIVAVYNNNNNEKQN